MQVQPPQHDPDTIFAIADHIWSLVSGFAAASALAIGFIIRRIRWADSIKSMIEANREYHTNEIQKMRDAHAASLEIICGKLDEVRERQERKEARQDKWEETVDRKVESFRADVEQLKEAVGAVRENVAGMRGRMDAGARRQ